MKADKRLRLSPYTVPELSIGRAPLSPQNSRIDRRRLQYLEGMISYLNGLFADIRQRHSRATALSRVKKRLRRMPHADLVELRSDEDPPVVESPGARDRIVFDQERLKIVFLDGKHRGSESPAVPAGRFSPEVSNLVARLARGVSERELAQMLDGCAVDLSGVVASLRRLGLIDEVDGSFAAESPAVLVNGSADSLAWLGHACVLFQTSRSSVCVDPFLRPHIMWTESETSTAFSEDYGDRIFFEPYGPDGPQLSPSQLPGLDAVFVTHQDIDHCNLGVLMMLPEEVPIIVPDWSEAHPWEVDLEALIHEVLGRGRRVIRLRHGESMRFGDIRATAFPFRYEMPSSLETHWNCYLFETDRAAVACTADAAMTDESVDFLIERVGKSRPLVLCARPVHSGAMSAGYRDEADSLYNFTRLWAWYVPVWDLFHPVEEPGISESRLRRLAGGTNLRAFLPYAMGSAPWFRIKNKDDPLYVPMANLSARDVHRVADTLASMPGSPALFPGKFARPVALRDL